MSRVIKFRAWDIDEGCWIPQVDFAVLADKDKVGPDFLSFDMRKNQYLGDCIPIVIEQFTGLLDREGAEIYDGDVVKIVFGIPPTVRNLLVKWSDDQYAGGDITFCGWWFEGLNGAHSAPMLSTYQHDIEIIGNKHQNPELLANGGESDIN